MCCTWYNVEMTLTGLHIDSSTSTSFDDSRDTSTDSSASYGVKLYRWVKIIHVTNLHIHNLICTIHTRKISLELIFLKLNRPSTSLMIFTWTALSNVQLATYNNNCMTCTWYSYTYNIIHLNGPWVEQGNLMDWDTRVWSMWRLLICEKWVEFCTQVIGAAPLKSQ